MDGERVIRVLDRILADPDLSERLDGLAEDAVRAEFFALYEAEEQRGE